VPAAIQERPHHVGLGGREEPAFGKDQGPVLRERFDRDGVLAQLALGQHHHVERLLALDEPVARLPERELHAGAVLLEELVAALHAERDGGLRERLRPVQRVLVVRLEVLDLDHDVVRRIERVLDHAAHPRAVRHAHVDPERRRLVLHHPEQVVRLAVLQLGQELGRDAAVRVLDDDDRLALRETRRVPAPRRLPVARAVHLGDEDVDLRLEGVVMRREVIEVAGH
jgi:hypothetical protein